MDGGSTLFNSTSRLAGEKAAVRAGSRRQRILTILEERPSALFEVASILGVHDHQISGRFTELAADGLIEQAGERRIKPGTSCQAEVWRIRQRAPVPDLAELLGYPSELLIDNQPFDRQPPEPAEHLPGVPFGRRADQGGVRLAVRVSLVECEGCGRPLKRVAERVGDKEQTIYRCGTTGCQSTWRLKLVRSPGGPELLALVMERLR